MLIPSRRLLLVMGMALALGGLVALVPSLGAIWIVVALAVVAWAVCDAVLALRQRTPEARRIVPTSLALAERREISIRLVNPGAATITMEVFDHHPHALQPEGLPRRARLEPGGWSELRYHVRPIARGDLRFGSIEARLDSPFGLWHAKRLIGAPEDVRVFPNFGALSKYALLATDHRLSQIGILQRRRRGEGMEFHQLREYRLGDSLRAIDWRATARATKLISREYQDERNQQIVFLLDCGRRMAAQDGALSHFDHMLNAALLLAYVSLRQGDAVGLQTMGTDQDGATRYLAPRRSGATVNRLLNTVYDLAPTLATTDYHRAAEELTRRISKRALIVVLTNLRDEDHPDLLPALRLLQRRHLVVLASLREQILGEALARPIGSFDDALTHAATAAYLHRRSVSFAKLERLGAICLDVEPGQLAVALVNRYLEVKRSGRL